MRCQFTAVCATVLLFSVPVVSAEELVLTDAVEMTMEARFEQLEREVEFLRSAGGTSKGDYADDCCDCCCWDKDWYISLSGGYNHRQQATETGTPGTFLTFTDGFGLNLALGMRRGMWRIEAETSYLNNYVTTASAQIAPNVALAGPADGNVGVQLFMLNLYRDFQLTERLRPYIGGGLGLGQSSINGLRPSTFGALGLPLEGVNATSDWPFAAQFRAGMSYALGCRTEAFVGYRYVYLNKLEFTHNPFGEFRPDGSRNHNVELGIRVNF